MEIPQLRNQGPLSDILLHKHIIVTSALKMETIRFSETLRFTNQST
jgi:hypothetical protein